MGRDQFLNLLSNLSPDSPLGRIEQLLNTPNKDLSNAQKIFKNRTIARRAGYTLD